MNIVDEQRRLEKVVTVYFEDTSVLVTQENAKGMVQRSADRLVSAFTLTVKQSMVRSDNRYLIRGAR